MKAVWLVVWMRPSRHTVIHFKIYSQMFTMFSKRVVEEHYRHVAYETPYMWEPVSRMI